MHSHGRESPAGVTSTSPFDLTDKQPSISEAWPLLAPRPRNLVLTWRSRRWRPLTVAGISAVVSTALVLDGALFLLEVGKTKAATVIGVVVGVGVFTALVIVLTALVLDRILVFRDHYINTSFAGLSGGVMLGGDCSAASWRR